jgi:YtcA family
VYPLSDMRVTLRRLEAAGLVFLAAGCDPIVNIQGSFFPAWMVCLVVGVALAFVLRYVFAITRLEPHLGPLVLIYPSLALLLTLALWLLLYRT